MSNFKSDELRDGYRLVARWESTRGAHVVELYKSVGSGWSYRSLAAGGYLGNHWANDAQVIAAFELRVDEFQPDCNKLPMKRIC